MAKQEVIDGLIGAYRDLNFRVRGLGEQASSNEALLAALRKLRDRELRASQGIKSVLAGLPVEENDELPLGDAAPAGGTTASSLLSQFGTAREATLSLVRELPEEEWAKVHATPQGEMSLHDYLKSLVERDRQQVEQINDLLKTHA